MFNRHLSAQGDYRFSLTYAPYSTQIFPLNTQGTVVGGVGADDGAVAEPDLTGRAHHRGDDLAVACDSVGHGCAYGGEEPGFTFDAGRPGVAVGGADDAPLPRLGIAQDEFGEGLGTGAGFAGAAAAEPQHDPPVPIRQQLIGSGHRAPQLGQIPRRRGSGPQRRNLEFPKFT